MYRETGLISQRAGQLQLLINTGLLAVRACGFKHLGPGLTLLPIMTSVQRVHFIFILLNSSESLALLFSGDKGVKLVEC